MDDENTGNATNAKKGGQDLAQAMNDIPNAEAVHKLFLGTNEIFKTFRCLAFLAEVLAIVIAMVAIFLPSSEWRIWNPAAAFVLALVSGVLRERAEFWKQHAQEFRRISLRSLVKQEDISNASAAMYQELVGLVAKTLVRMLPSTTLEQYYCAEMEPGVNRLRELYCHSAYFSYRLLSLFARAIWIAVGGVGFVCFAVLYKYLVVTPVSGSDSLFLVEIICGTILVFGFVQLWLAATRAANSSKTCFSIATNLVLTNQNTNRDSQISALAHSYDFERATGAHTPTIIYRLFRKVVANGWDEFRKGLDE